MANKREDGLVDAERERARGRDANAQPSEGPRAHSGDNAGEFAWADTGLGETLGDEVANRLGVTAGVRRVARGEYPSVAVDDGKFARDRQIGATGKTVSASAYIAVGISGAVQHLQGIKDCRHVIAINRDNSAPIVKRADLSIIGDAEAIMQALISAIAEVKSLAAHSPELQPPEQQEAA